MLFYQSRPPAWISTCLPWPRGNEDVDVPGRRDAKQAKAKHAAKLSHAGICFAPPATCGKANGEPYFVAGTHSLDALEHELKVEAELQLPDYDDAVVIA